MLAGVDICLDKVGHVCDVHAHFVLVAGELLHREGVVQIPKLKVDLLDALRVKGRHDTGRFILDTELFRDTFAPDI